MSLPTKDDLSTLDFAYLGMPFVQVESKSGLNTNSLDFAYLGMPFVAVISDGAEPPPVVTFNATRMFMIF